MTETRILIVEDDFLIRMTLAEALAEDGFTVVEASSGEEGVALAAADPTIRLTALDFHLGGGLDGEAAAQAIRAERPDMPILFMTGRPDAVRTRGQRDGLLRKPYRPSEACAAVRSLLNENTTP